MKKLFLLAVLTLASVSAKAQFFTGLAFDVKWANNGSINSSGVDTKTDNAYGGEISPQVGYQFSPKMMLGGRINFLFDKNYYTETDSKTKAETKYVMSSIGWDVAPFFRYRMVALGENEWFSIWADFHTYFGMKYPRNARESGYITKTFNKKYIYGIQAMPALGFRINEHSMAFINFAIVSLAYSGSYTIYDDKTEYENNLVLFTGKLNGLFTTMAAEGMYSVKFGMIRTF